jgi:hypothetical protein
MGFGSPLMAAGHARRFLLRILTAAHGAVQSPLQSGSVVRSQQTGQMVKIVFAGFVDDAQHTQFQRSRIGHHRVDLSDLERRRVAVIGKTDDELAPRVTRRAA